MGFLRKLQNQPEHIRKIILWGTVVILGLGLAIWWINSSYRSLKGFEKEKFIEKMNLPNFMQGLEDLPEIKMPEINEEELKNLEREINQQSTTNNEQ